MSLNTATINFGGINASKLEFVDFSTDESKEFFQRLQEHFESFTGDHGDTSLRRFIIDSMGKDQISYVNYLLDCATKFIVENMTPEFVQSIHLGDEPFDLGNTPMNTFFINVLKRDKGIGGFEQMCQSRPTNIGNINQFLVRDPEAGAYTFDSTKYLEVFKKYYIDETGIEYAKITNLKSYRDVFLKGRKEGPNKSQMNYYQFVEKGSVENGDSPTDARSTLFQSLANLIMMTYDLISLELILGSDGVVPSNIPEKMSPEELGILKTGFIFNFLRTQQTDILFVTECIHGAFFAQRAALRTMGYTIEYGEECGGLCNAIIYKPLKFEAPLVFTRVAETVYPATREYKEPPLHLRNQDGTLNLVCYHANGKGVTVDKPLGETSFYNWISGMTGKVIVGGDLNMDYKKCGAEFTGLLDIGTISDGAFSCYKQRSPLQAQYDKAGVFDTKFCDYIITRGYQRAEVQVIRASPNGNALQLNAPNNFTRDDLVIPNNSFPFEHYIVMDLLEPETCGFTFFSTYLPALSWMDSVVNWVFGN